MHFFSRSKVKGQCILHVRGKSAHIARVLRGKVLLFNVRASQNYMRCSLLIIDNSSLVNNL